jgi:PadR family transcriptional regulator, regulatory protein AphA
MKADWPSENVLLGLLAEKPMHGYELAQRAHDDEALRAIWRIERSEVYFLLGKLSKCGYVNESEEQAGNGPARVVFEVTAAGREALNRWLSTPEQYPRNLRSALLARVYLALRQDPQIALNLIDAQRIVLEDWLARFRQRAFSDPVVAVVHNFRAAQVEGILKALDQLRDLAVDRQRMAQ